MISPDLAAQLRDAGLTWRPAPADQFMIPQPDMAGQVFTLSDMTIEAHEYPSGTILGFNGTTEWALDSITLENALWLPREDQLRELLGGTFRSLDRDVNSYRVWTGEESEENSEQIYTADTAADAYGLALLALITRSTA